MITNVRVLVMMPNVRARHARSCTVIQTNCMHLYQEYLAKLRNLAILIHADMPFRVHESMQKLTFILPASCMYSMTVQHDETRTMEFSSAAALEQFLGENSGAVHFVKWTNNSVIVSGDIAQKAPVAMPAKPRVKRLAKKESATLMHPNIDMTGYTEVQVDKYFFKCLDCGLVWQTEIEASICAVNKHASAHVRKYGGRVIDGVRSGHGEFLIHAVRQEAAERSA